MGFLASKTAYNEKKISIRRQMYMLDKEKQGILPIKDFIQVCESQGARLCPKQIQKLDYLFKEKKSGTLAYKEALRCLEFCSEKGQWVIRNPGADRIRGSCDRQQFYRTARDGGFASLADDVDLRRNSE
jgi:hypothetical protein